MKAFKIYLIDKMEDVSKLCEKFNTKFKVLKKIIEKEERLISIKNFRDFFDNKDLDEKQKKILRIISFKFLRE
jgi:hypothetical protein